MFERLVFLLDRGGMVIVLSCLCVGFFFLHAKIKEIWGSVEGDEPVCRTP